MKRIVPVAMIFAMLFSANLSFSEEKVMIDAAGRKVKLSDRVERVICSGAGCLRLLTYLQAQHLIVAVDDMEKRRPIFDARPYALANPQFKGYPLFGEFRGYDNPELIMALNPQPQAIFKTFSTIGHDPEKLQKKTSIPVVVLEYGDLSNYRNSFYQALRMMGKVVGGEKRAEELISFFESTIKDLEDRTKNVPESERKTCYVGGIAFKGPHGFRSTELNYPPFLFVNARNVAYGSFMKEGGQSNVAKEKIIEWDPEILFLDLSTLQMGDKAGGLFELKTDPAYQALTAVQKGQVYGALPYNWYAQNFGSILANAYFIAKLLYAHRFRDVNPETKADEIYTFLVGKPVFREMDRMFQGLVFKKISVK
jgi:iron complex transport system substrate-binding protein